MGLFPRASSGPDDDWRRQALDRFARAYNAGEGVANVVEDVQPARWKKRGCANDDDGENAKCSLTK